MTADSIAKCIEIWPDSTNASLTISNLKDEEVSSSNANSKSNSFYII